MPLKPSKFALEEEISVSGKVLRVVGRLQLEDADGQPLTRYQLAEPSGAAQILEERAAGFALLRQFSSAAQPVAAGSTVTVMGEKYTLAKVSKLKVLGVEGRPPGGAPNAPLVLSGAFQGSMGALLREMAPGAAAQSFFSLKPLQAEEVLSGAQRGALAEAERLAAEQRAQAEAESGEEDGAGSSPLKKAVGWIVTILVVVGLAYACSGSDEESWGSARSSFSRGSSGGK